MGRGAGIWYGGNAQTVFKSITNKGSLVETNVVNTAVNYSLGASDYLLNCTASCTVSLPDINAVGIGIGKVYEILSNSGLTITINAFTGQTIDGGGSTTVMGYNMVRVKAISLTQWRII